MVAKRRGRGKPGISRENPRGLSPLGDCPEWHEDSRKFFGGNRMACQHIDASISL